MFKRKKSSKKSGKPSDVKWVLEGIVEYLQTPVFTTPIMNFIDQNCHCFELKEENKFEYTEVHNDYKVLVENLVLQYTKELNISQELFDEACTRYRTSMRKVQGLFKYVWAADDFILFKQIMGRHNVEIEMQTHAMLANYGEKTKVPAEDDDFIMNKSKQEFEMASNELSKIQEMDTRNLEQAIEYSKRESERLNKLALLEDEMMRKAIALSLEQSSGDDSAMKNRDITSASETNDFSDVPSTSKANNYEGSKIKVSKVTSGKIVTNDVPSTSKAAVFEDNTRKLASEIESKELTQSKPIKSETFENNTNTETGNLNKNLLGEKKVSKDSIIKKLNPFKNTKESIASSRNQESESLGNVSEIKLDTSGKKPSSNSKKPLTQELNPIKSHQDSSDIATDWINSAKQENIKTEPFKPAYNPSTEYKSYNSNSISPEELAKRKKYLEEQRQKILALKRQQRDDQLRDHQMEREQQDEDEEPVVSEEEFKRMKSRLAVASKLKRDVVGKKY